MVCTTLVVQQPQPVVTLVEIGFAKKDGLGNWVSVDPSCNEGPALIGKDVGMLVKITVAVNKATFSLVAGFTDPKGAGIAPTPYSFTGVAIGTYTYALTTFSKYEAGTYSNLAGTVQSVTPG